MSLRIISIHDAEWGLCYMQRGSTSLLVVSVRNAEGSLCYMQRGPTSLLIVSVHEIIAFVAAGASELEVREIRYTALNSLGLL